MKVNFLFLFFSFPSFAYAGYSAYVGHVGGKIALPCNTTSWGDEYISLVLWYKETAEVGLPIYSIDARTTPLSKSKHTVPPEYKDRLFFDVTLKPPVLRIDPILEEDNGDFRCRVSTQVVPSLANGNFELSLVQFTSVS